MTGVTKYFYTRLDVHVWKRLEIEAKLFKGLGRPLMFKKNLRELQNRLIPNGLLM